MAYVQPHMNKICFKTYSGHYFELLEDHPARKGVDGTLAYIKDMPKGDTIEVFLGCWNPGYVCDKPTPSVRS